MSDWNQLPNWDPLGWAQLTEEKRQNNYNNFTRPWQQAVDLFSKYFTQQNEQDYQVNKLLPAQTSAAIKTATAQNALPMTDYQSQSLGVQKEQAEKANSIQERIAKYQEEMLAAQTDEEKKRLQAEIDKLNLELITARQDYQNSLAGIKGADKQTTYKSAMDDFFGKIFADQNYGVKIGRAHV